MTMPLAKTAAESMDIDDSATGVRTQDAMRVELSADRLLRAKFAYTARHAWSEVEAAGGEGYGLVRGTGVRPRAGDLVLARVVEIGQHKRIESHDSYRRHLFVGDEIVVAYGARYAPDQFLAELPTSLDTTSLVAAGGIAADVREQHARIAPATRIEPIGL
ncbi:MAG: DUF1611 domain-containing protein, partial [Pseudoclavibacter sp.]